MSLVQEANFVHTQQLTGVT